MAKKHGSTRKVKGLFLSDAAFGVVKATLMAEGMSVPMTHLEVWAEVKRELLDPHDISDLDMGTVPLVGDTTEDEDEADAESDAGTTTAD